MEAGALGAEIIISGKLTTERARFEKFKAGHFPIVGEPAARAMKTAVAHVQLKPGMIGVRVKIMPPDAYFPDKVTVHEALPAEEKPVVPEEAVAKPAEEAQEQTATAVPVEEAPPTVPEPEVQAAEVKKEEPKKEEEKQ
jgi:small subunit ribosomal protein S3